MRRSTGIKSVVLLCAALCFLSVLPVLGEEEPEPRGDDPVAELLNTKDPEEVTVKDLFEAADHVVRATVKDIEVKYVAPEESEYEGEPTGVLTLVTFEAQTWYKVPEQELEKNPEGQEFIVLVYGGVVTVGDYVVLGDALYVGGTPDFERGQDIILFLSLIKKTPYLGVLLDSHGVYIVEKDLVYNQGLGRKRSLVSLDIFVSQIKELTENGRP